jgi:DNA-directed RNA polymerase subunit RPC12/RpoP
LCGAEGEVVEKVYPATGDHTDKEGDGNHKCDVCGAKNVTAHVEGEVQREDEEPSFCKKQGSYHLVVYCVECEDELRNTVLYLPLDPDNHKDGKDADHNCDYCGLKIEDHTPGKPVEEKRIEPTKDTDGSYKKVIYCTECGEKLSEETVVIPALKKDEPDDKVESVNKDVESDDKAEPDDSELVASLFGDGSLVIVCSFFGFAVLAAIVIYLQKKKKSSKGEVENE